MTVLKADPTRWGVWNTVSKEFQFGINTETAAQAYKGLQSKIGRDSLKWRFEVRKITSELVKQHNKSKAEVLRTRAQHLQSEIKKILLNADEFEKASKEA